MWSLITIMTKTMSLRSSLASRWCAAASFGAVVFASAVLSSPLSASAAASPPAAPLPPCAISGGVSVVLATTSATGELNPTCVPQSGQILVIVSNPTPLAQGDPNAPTLGAAANASALGLPSSATPLGLAATPVPFDMVLVTSDTRIDSYAKRQAIRDKYRGQIDETTFNDELGDGVGLDQALQDAMAALGRK
jgi:hypothetical protein